MTTAGLGNETLLSSNEIEVRTRFDGRWVRGFEIAANDLDSYLIRRRSDGTVLPFAFAADEIRRARPSYRDAGAGSPRR
jgi:hypothetical protein